MVLFDHSWQVLLIIHCVLNWCVLLECNYIWRLTFCSWINSPNIHKICVLMKLPQSKSQVNLILPNSFLPCSDTKHKIARHKKFWKITYHIQNPYNKVAISRHNWPISLDYVFGNNNLQLNILFEAILYEFGHARYLEQLDKKN